MRITESQLRKIVREAMFPSLETEMLLSALEALTTVPDVKVYPHLVMYAKGAAARREK